MTTVTALLLLAVTGSGVVAVRVAVFRTVPTLPLTCASMTKVTLAPAGTVAALQVTVCVAFT